MRAKKTLSVNALKVLCVGLHRFRKTEKSLDTLRLRSIIAISWNSPITSCLQLSAIRIYQTPQRVTTPSCGITPVEISPTHGITLLSVTIQKPANKPMPWLEKDLYQNWLNSGLSVQAYLDQTETFQAQSLQKKPSLELMKQGLVGLDCRYLNFAPQCHGWMNLTQNGGSRLI